jgi:DNA primase
VAFSNSTIDEIAESIDIVELISQYTPLRKAGRSFVGRCPFHQEKTPSFSVSQEKKVYHCFGCGKSGNIFHFVMEIDKVSFMEAAKILADKAGIKLEINDNYKPEERNQIEILFDIHKHAGMFYFETLHSKEGSYAKEYLNHRGVNNESIFKFGIGFSPIRNDTLYNHLINNFSHDDIIASGLVIDSGNKIYRDRFNGRLMFPIISESSKIVGFAGRKLSDDRPNEAKYINSPETRIYNKSKILYGLNFAKNEIKNLGYAILVEGYMDLISLYQHSITNVVASSGTSLTDLQIKILSRYTQETVILFDSDLAGQNASRRAIEIVLRNNLNPSIAILPKGEDPDSYIIHNSKESFLSLIENRKDIIDYILDKYKQENKFNTPEEKTKFIKEIIPLIAHIRDPIRREFYIQEISRKSKIFEHLLRREMQNIIDLKSRGLTREIDEEIDDEIKDIKETDVEIPVNELALLKLFLDSKDVIVKKYIIENIEIDFFSNLYFTKIINYILKNFDDHENLKPARLLNFFEEPQTKSILSRTILKEDIPILPEGELSSSAELAIAKSIIGSFRMQKLNKEINNLQMQIKQKNEASDKTLRKLQKLLAQKTALEKERKN